MNKKQTAEWLAGNVLGCTYCKECDVWVSDTVKDDIVKFIYSPDGFFAVWDAVIKKFPSLEIAFLLTAYETICCVFTNHDDGDADWMFNQFGEDRYEAFYGAVYEARGYEVRNEKINTNS